MNRLFKSLIICFTSFFIYIPQAISQTGFIDLDMPVTSLTEKILGSGAFEFMHHGMVPEKLVNEYISERNVSLFEGVGGQVSKDALLSAVVVKEPIKKYSEDRCNQKSPQEKYIAKKGPTLTHDEIMWVFKKFFNAEPQIQSFLDLIAYSGGAKCASNEDIF